jgi:hypothetical protein
VSACPVVDDTFRQSDRVAFGAGKKCEGQVELGMSVRGTMVAVSFVALAARRREQLEGS